MFLLLFPYMFASISDALLPVIIDFLKLFPQYLEVVGRCARKTEVALWRHLFHNVGSPEELFTVRALEVVLLVKT